MERLDKYFREYNRINEDTIYNVFYMEAEELVNEKRIDILVKYYYIKARESGENLDLAREMYEKHIEAFSDGTFKEHGNEEKNSIEAYIKTFNDLIDNFKKLGFDEELSLIPVGKDKEILDGSHRAACALYFNEKVKVVQFPDLSVDYGFEFFRKRQLDDFYLDFIAKEYIRFRKDTYALFSWPLIGTGKNIKYVEKYLRRSDSECNVIYKKILSMDKSRFWNFVINVYRKEHWVGHPGNNFKWANAKRDNCYKGGGLIGVFIVSSASVECLEKEKQELRNHFNLGDRSIHNMDTYEESVEILELILDKDYDKALYESFLADKATHFTFKKYIIRRVRYFYRMAINIAKKIIGRPV